MARQKDNTNAPQEKQRRTRRSKAEIEQDLSTAITRIITTQGFTKLTINNVSEESHVIKRVIYENYKSFERLLQVYFVKNDFWTALILSKIADRCSDYKEFFTAVLKEFYKSIDENPIFQCIVRWEVAAPNNFVRNGAKNRENNCREELLKNKAFFQPLGIEKPFWETDGKGNNAGGWGLYMKTEDLAKFFLLIAKHLSRTEIISLYRRWISFRE